MLCLHGLSLFHPEVNVLVIEQLLEKKGSHLAVVSFLVCLLTTLTGTTMLSLLQMTMPTVMTLTPSQS